MKKQRMLSLLLAFCLIASLIPGAALAAGAGDFADVKEGDWYYPYVDFVASKGYFVGTGKNTFSPGGTMTRAMFVAVLARMDGADTPNNVSPFSDVAAGEWYAGAVKWAAENGLVAGVGNNRFNPNGEINREQMCVIMNQFIDYYGKKTGQAHKAEGSADAFPDAAQVSSYAVQAVNNCRRYGLIVGCGDGTFRPQNNATRAEVATVIYKLDWLVKSSTGGGGGGGGTTTYTLTYDATGGTIDGEATYRVSQRNNSTFTVTDKIPVRDGYTFIGWGDMENVFSYKAGDSFSPNGTSGTLYAVWVENADYLGLATANASQQAKRYAEKAEGAAGTAIDKAGIADVVSADVVYDTTVNGSGAAAYRTVAVTGDAALKTSSVVTLVQKATAYACAFVTDDAENELTKDDIKSVINEIAGQLGVTIDTWTVDAIAETVKAKLGSSARSLWSNYKNYPDNEYGFTSVDVLNANGGKLFSVKIANNQASLDGIGRKDAAAKAGAAIAKAMYADLKQSAGGRGYVSTVTMNGALRLRFNGVKPEMSSFPSIYEFQLSLTLSSEYIQYKYENNTSYVNLVIDQAMQEQYHNSLDQAVKASLQNPTVQNELKTRIDRTVDTFTTNSTFNKLVSAMTRIGISEADARLKVKNAMTVWKDENMDVTDLANSPMFKLYWEKDEDAGYENASVYQLVEYVADRAADYAYDLVAAESDFAAKLLFKDVRVDDLKGILSDKDIDLGLDAYPEIEAYVLARMCDQLREKAAGSDENFAGTAASAMQAEMDQLIRGALEDTDYYGYLEKALKLQNVSTLKDVKLNSLATVLANKSVQGAVGDRGSSMVKRLKSLIDKLPENASVTINGSIELSAATLDGVRNAADNAATCDALAALLRSTGLAELSLNSFEEPGVELTVKYGGRSFSCNLVVTIEE